MSIQKYKENIIIWTTQLLFLCEVIKGKYELDNKCDECKEVMRCLLLNSLDLNKEHSTANVTNLLKPCLRLNFILKQVLVDLSLRQC